MKTNVGDGTEPETEAQSNLQTPIFQLGTHLAKITMVGF